MTASLCEQLLAIRRDHGHLDNELVVEVARDPAHPLHHRFDWDDSVAGHKWRLEQASQLLRVVKKVPGQDGQPHDLRAFVAVKGQETNRSDYVPVEEAFADGFARSLVLRNMEREWRTLERRYRDMAEFADLIRRYTQGAA